MRDGTCPPMVFAMAILGLLVFLSVRGGGCGLGCGKVEVNEWACVARREYLLSGADQQRVLSVQPHTPPRLQWGWLGSVERRSQHRRSGVPAALGSGVVVERRASGRRYSMQVLLAPAASDRSMHKAYTADWKLWRRMV